MPRLAANLSFLFQEDDFLDRFEAASSCGFVGVEFLFPYDHPAAVIAEAARAAGVSVVLFNLPPGDWAAGERGIAALPGREAEFRAAVDCASAYAAALGTPTLHVMAGVLPPDADRDAARATYCANLRYAAAKVPPG
ncbi:TIM barrel protein, partial [bacterium]|nr:TIM barrel protein [bacterium]